MLSTIDLPHTGVGLGGVSQYRSHDELSIGYNVINYYLGNLSETTYSYSGAHLPILIIKSLPLILQSHARDLYYNNKSRSKREDPGGRIENGTSHDARKKIVSMKILRTGACS